MKSMNAEIHFGANDSRGALLLRKPASVQIKKSWKLLTDRAKFELPKNVQDFDNQKVQEVFKKGDSVRILLGYDGEFNEEFVGYITNVSAGYPVRIECEDEMWKLKQIPVDISLKSTTLKTLLTTILPSYEVDVIEDWDIGKVRYVGETVATVLKDIKKTYNLYSYMDGKRLVCGKIYADDSEDDIAAINIEREVVQSGNRLRFTNADDIKVLIKASSLGKNGKQTKAQYGEVGGEVHKLVYAPGIEDSTALEAFAKRDYENRKKDKLSGSVELLGSKIIQHGQKVQLSSNQYPEQNGTYYVDEVNLYWGNRPAFRRTIKIGALYEGN